MDLIRPYDSFDCLLFLCIKYGLDIHFPMEIRVIMSEFLSVIDEEFHN